MKIIFCADLQSGAVSTVNLGAELSRKWRSARSGKLDEFFDKAMQCNAEYVALFGKLFGRQRVPESVIDALFMSVQKANSLQVLAVVSPDEFKRASYRTDIPQNLHLINAEADGMYTDNEIALITTGTQFELQVGDAIPVAILRSENGGYTFAAPEHECILPAFEPTGFEAAGNGRFGFLSAEWRDDVLVDCSQTDDALFAYKQIEMRISPADDQKEILERMNSAVRKLDRRTFLRITLAGRSSFGLVINSEALKSHLQNHVFYAEVFDNTVMDISESDFEADISLRSEFVRLALQDDSLSESERNRLISYGWNALGGREVTEG